MTTIENPIRNGVDTATLFATLDAVKANPEIGKFQFRATNRWISGTHNQSTIHGFYAAGGEDGSRPVPLRLRNAPTRLMKDIGYGKGYRYAHDEENAFAAGERYFPDGMADVEWYVPTDRGLEAKLKEKLAWLRQCDREAREGDADTH